MRDQMRELPPGVVHRLFFVLLVGCGSLPPPGSCEVPTTGTEAVDVATVPLAPGFLDDVTFARRLGKVIAPPEGVGQLFVIDPDSLAVEVVDVPDGVGSADATETTIYAGDRDG